jgi:hypothetical protein
MKNPLETLLDKYSITDILSDNDIEEITVLRLLVAENLIDLDNYELTEEDVEDDD